MMSIKEILNQPKYLKFMYCKKCESNQIYRQRDEEGITWIYCPVCQYKEHIKSYFAEEKMECRGK
jgi:RNase P subunit RPR2